MAKMTKMVKMVKMMKYGHMKMERRVVFQKMTTMMRNKKSNPQEVMTA